MTPYPSLSLAFELLDKAAYLCPRPPVGCSPLQLETMEQELGHALPPAYRAFLERLGKDDGGCFLGQKWTAESLRLNHMLLDEVLEENELRERLPAEHLVFVADEGMLYAWFKLPATDEDPPVYALTLGEETTHEDIQEYPSFSSFLLESLTHAVEALLEATETNAPRVAGEFPVVARFESPEDAAMAKNALLHEGIRAFVTHSQFSPDALMHVNERELDRARSLLQQWTRGPT